MIVLVFYIGSDTCYSSVLLVRLLVICYKWTGELVACVAPGPVYYLFLLSTEALTTKRLECYTYPTRDRLDSSTRMRANITHFAEIHVVNGSA